MMVLKLIDTMQTMEDFLNNISDKKFVDVINLDVILRLGLKYVEWYRVKDHLARNHAHPFIYGDTANHIHNLLYIMGCVRMNPKYRE